MNALAEQNVDVLESGVELLQTLTDAEYTTPVGPRPFGTVGAQFRHVIDMHTALLQGVDTGRIDYDERERSPAVETDRELATRRLQELAAALRRLDEQVTERDVSVNADVAEPRPEAKLWTRSTVGRELRFVLSHTIHHYATVRVLLEGLGHRLAPDFGVAPSTLAQKQATRGTTATR